MTEPRVRESQAKQQTYHERKRALENAWIEVGAWVIVGLGVLLVLA